MNDTMLKPFFQKDKTGPARIESRCLQINLIRNSRFIAFAQYVAVLAAVIICLPIIATAANPPVLVPMVNYSQVPPYVCASVPPNVLLILDNSNSMDEDFVGNAVGSWASNSKSVVGKNALINIINTYSNVMNIGLMTYNLPGIQSKFLYNSAYFASYNAKSYCPNPPPECSDYCLTGNSTSKSYCQTTCATQNSTFDATYLDEIISGSAIGSARRNTYCPLVYPKTIATQNPTDSLHSIYYKMALPYYANSNSGIEFDYSSSYRIGAYPSVRNCYTAYHTKTGTDDGGTTGTPGYTNSFASPCYVPTDSDIALGFDNFGRRMFSQYVTKTWFASGSPGSGYLKVPVGSNNAATLLTALTTYEGNVNGYMSCANTSNPNACSYIVNAGLTPTAGTLQTAADSFSGANGYTSPVQYRCQRNVIVYVTDGSPSVSPNGTVGSSSVLMPGVLSKIDALRNLSINVSGTARTFDVNTYVLGMGLTPADIAKVDEMAQHGGTAVGGHAYYANDANQLNSALSTIFQGILDKVSSGTSASMLSNNDNNGAVLLQALFYPRKIFASSQLDWIGELQSLWYYLDPFLRVNAIREDTVTDDVLKLNNDNVLQYYFDDAQQQAQVNRFKDASGDGKTLTYVDTVSPDALNSLWNAGRQLWSRNLTTSPRTIYTTLDGATLIDFATSNDAALQTLIQAASTTEADNLINYIAGTDQAGYRSRTVSINKVSGVWRLGDILSATPRLQSSVRLNSYNLEPPKGYNDTSYATYIGSRSYKTRGMVYAGANDGMLHAFNLGTLSQGKNTSEISKITGSNLGTEAWSFIPKNVLPYLKYLTDPHYSHLYYVDSSPYLTDASIASCSQAGNYWDCPKVESKINIQNDGSYDIDPSNASWRTVLIGGMGLGGASRDLSTAGTGNFVKTPISGVGYSSYFALDVTDPADPSLLWEFSDTALGYSTVGPAVVRIGNRYTNGRWYAVLASGPTGPIDTSLNQFKGYSDQNLKIFILDLKTGQLLRTIDTGITNAFAGSLSNATIDTDRPTPGHDGNYSDDALYVGYVQLDTATGTWTKGGVLRILTGENSNPVTTDLNPGQWTVSTVISGIGPVTTPVSKIQDTDKNNLWLYFGTGRYFYKDGTGVDDANSRQALYGVKEPCYNKRTNYGCVAGAITASSLTDQTTTISSSLPANSPGWVINLASSNSTTGLNAERVITTPVAAPNGAIFFTTFKPSTDVCSYGGNTTLWAVKYATGGALRASALRGTAIVQVSTGAFQQIALSSSFTENGGRQTKDLAGVPPQGPPMIVTNAALAPARKIVHIREH